ncbi:MAG: hypothetical protein ACM3MF_05870 [Anaerolineae bacterium]
MADNKVNASSDKVFKLGGPADVDIEGLDPSAVEVFTTDKNIGDAKAAYPTYDWFIDYNVKIKNSNDYSGASYTLKFNKAAGTLYAYYHKTLHTLQDVSDAGTKNGKARSKVTLNIGDPAIGRG